LTAEPVEEEQSNAPSVNNISNLIEFIQRESDANIQVLDVRTLSGENIPTDDDLLLMRESSQIHVANRSQLEVESMITPERYRELFSCCHFLGMDDIEENIVGFMCIYKIHKNKREIGRGFKICNCSFESAMIKSYEDGNSGYSLILIQSYLQNTMFGGSFNQGFIQLERVSVSHCALVQGLTRGEIYCDDIILDSELHILAFGLIKVCYHKQTHTKQDDFLVPDFIEYFENVLQKSFNRHKDGDPEEYVKYMVNSKKKRETFKKEGFIVCCIDFMKGYDFIEPNWDASENQVGAYKCKRLVVMLLTINESILKWVKQYNPDFEEEYKMECFYKYEAILCVMGKKFLTHTNCSQDERRQIDAKIMLESN